MIFRLFIRRLQHNGIMSIIGESDRKIYSREVIHRSGGVVIRDIDGKRVRETVSEEQDALTALIKKCWQDLMIWRAEIPNCSKNGITLKTLKS